MSNSTHETHTACIERIRKEGASSTCCYCNPHEGCTLGIKPTQNDWADAFRTKFEGKNVPMNSVHPIMIDSQIIYIQTLLADARKEVITDKIDRVKLYEVIKSIYLSGMYAHDKGVLRQYMSDIINVLATLKEEEKVVEKSI